MTPLSTTHGTNIHTVVEFAGALLIDKPAGPTSHDVVAFVRRALRLERAGHTGTLDPLATGLLIVLVGSATRLAQFVAPDEKEYIADVRLGISTPTYDAASLSEGVRWAMAGGRWPMDAEIEAVLATFRGTFLQTPPRYSAKKIASVPAYEKARKNQSVDLKPVEVSVRALDLLGTSGSLRPAAGDHPPEASDHPPSAIDPQPPDIEHGSLLRLRVAASAGFYVRSLAHDIGQALGCGAHLEGLRRTRVGRFRVDEAMTLDRVESEGAARLRSSSDILGHMPAVVLTDGGVRRVAHGNPFGPSHIETEHSPTFPQENGTTPFLRVLDGSGRLVAVAERRAGAVLQPIVVLR
jgi:tRNA pseudouridine55 synthase